MRRNTRWRTWATGGLLVVLAGCTAQPGSGCSPTAQPTTTTTSSTTTTPTSTSTTTTQPDGSTTTTTQPDGSTTTTTQPDGSTTTTTVPGGGGEVVPADELAVEDCLIPVGDDVMVESVELIDCDDPHEAEVFAQFDVDPDDLPEGTGPDGYPGGSELTWFGQDECQDRFEDYTGESYWTSRYDVLVVTPSFSSWSEGDRAVTCLLVDPDGGVLTGSGKA